MHMYVQAAYIVESSYICFYVLSIFSCLHDLHVLTSSDKRIKMSLPRALAGRPQCPLGSQSPKKSSIFVPLVEDEEVSNFELTSRAPRPVSLE